MYNDKERAKKNREVKELHNLPDDEHVNSNYITDKI
jgi:hypothetical protein